MEKTDIKEVPQYIYKYMPLDGFIEMITQRTLYFATPIMYNDPFDTKADVCCDSSPEDMRKFWSNSGYKNDKIEEFLKNKHQIKKLANEAYTEILSDFRICCFSQVCDNILMWSHYSNMHKGVCVKFDRNKDELFNSATLISYEDKVPEYNFVHGKDEDIHRVIYAKSIDWEYEKEIRIIKHTKQGITNKVFFEKRALSEVILGCRFPEHKKLALQAVIKKYKYHATLSQMNTSEKEYKLIKKPLILPK